MGPRLATLFVYPSQLAMNLTNIHNSYRAVTVLEYQLELTIAIAS